MASRRLFIAVDISDEARRLAAEHIDSLRQNAREVRVGWERPEKLHVTLKFLGSVDEENVCKVNDAVAVVGAEYHPFELSIEDGGVFPNTRQPRVLWLGVQNSGGTLANIATEIDDRMSSMGFEKEKRAFNPHLTIARIREPQKAKRLAEVHLQSRFLSQPFVVRELVVYESVLKRTGSVYDVISKHRL